MKQTKKLLLIFGLIFIVSCIIKVNSINAYKDEFWVFLQRSGFDTHLYRFEDGFVGANTTYLGTTPDDTNTDFYGGNNYVVVNGTIYYLSVRDNAPTGIDIYNSTDKGVTFTLMQHVIGGGNINSVAIDYAKPSEYLHIAWQNNHDIRYANYSLETNILTIEPATIIDGDLSSYGVSLQSKGNNDVFIVQCAGFGGNANPTFQYKKRIAGLWSGLYQYTSGGAKDCYYPQIIFDNLHDVLIITYYDMGDSAVWVATNNRTTAIGIDTAWTRATSLTCQAYYHIGYEKEIQRLDIVIPRNIAGDRIIHMSQSSYPHLGFYLWNANNYTGKDLQHALLFDVPEKLNNRIVAVMTNPSPDKAYVFTEGFNKRPHPLLHWFGLNQFNTQSDVTRLWSSWEFGGNVYIPYPRVYNLTIPDIDGNYLFESETYTLKAEVENTEYAEFNFTDSIHDIMFIYNSSLIGMSISSSEENTIYMISAESNLKNNTHNVLEWEFRLMPNIVDFHIEFDGLVLNTFNEELINTSYNNLFDCYIFNLGEYTEYDIVGTGEHIQYDDPLAVECWGAGSMVTATTTFRKLQHMHFNVELDNGGDWDAVGEEFVNMTGGYYEFGMNYMINNTMLNGWYVLIYPYTYDVGNHGGFADSDWIKWKVEHHSYNASYGNYQVKKEEFLYSNYNGYDNEHSTDGYTNKTNINWWIDLWFSNENSSSIVSTRINPEYYGMYEQGNPFWFGYGNFRPMFGDIELSMFFEAAYNGVGDITTIHGQVDLVQFYSRVGVASGENVYQIKNFEMKNKEFSIGDMIGIDTPALVETKVIDMPQTGFLSPLIKMISSIGSLIIGAIFYILGGLGGLVDNMLIRLGLPPIMSIFYEMLRGIYSIFEIIYASFSNMIDWLIESATQIISSLFLVIPRYLLFVGMMLSVFISYYNNIILLFTGGIGNMSNFWTDYSVTDIIQLWLVGILPFTIIARIESSKEPIKQLGEDIELFVKMVKAVFSIANDMLKVLLGFIKTIIGVI